MSAKGMSSAKIKRRKRALLGMYVDRCAYCECALTDQNRTIDHIVPRSRGGSDAVENLVLACEPCNTKKDDRTPAEAG